MPPRVVGPWPLERIEQFFTAQAIPLRLGCRTASGWPLVASHWYLYRDGALWCATQAGASIVRHLRADSRCAFEVATNGAPYRGVRGQARAHVVPDAGGAVLRDLIHRYLGGEESDFARWLLSRTADEVAIRLDPVRLRSWDFTRRMMR
jgi:hypothetical protein